MNKRREYIDQMTKKLNEWDLEIKEVEQKIDNMQAKARTKYLIYIQELRLKKQEVQNKLEDIRNTSEEAWDELKTGLDKSWEILHNSTKKAFFKFKS